MNESHGKHEVIVGLFVSIGLIFLLGGTLMVGNLHETFNSKIGVFSLFDDVNGLQKGNNVWYSGVKIGTVSSLRFYGKSQVEVKIDIQTKTRKYIRKDAKVKISSEGFIGNKILVIYGGTEKFPEVDDGDTLEVEKSFSSEDILNTFQDNNKNILVITNDLKTITKKLADGEGTIGKFLNDSSVYTNINTSTASLKITSAKAQQLVGSLETFSSNLNKEGTLASDLTSDTLIFKSVKTSVLQLQQIADMASVFISNLEQAGSNPNSPIGILLNDEESGERLKGTIVNLESSSKKLNEDLEAVQHNFLLKRFLKRNRNQAQLIPSEK
jgi:phospholipid/cholesterol/gamma-HCH transport system substrate-binding protein